MGVGTAGLSLHASHEFDRHCSDMRATTFDLVFSAQLREHDGVFELILLEVGEPYRGRISAFSCPITPTQDCLGYDSDGAHSALD